MQLQHRMFRPNIGRRGARPYAKPSMGIHVFCFDLNIYKRHIIENLYYYSFLAKVSEKVEASLWYCLFCNETIQMNVTINHLFPKLGVARTLTYQTTDNGRSFFSLKHYLTNLYISLLLTKR